jgi:hypothetical protein
MIFSPDFNLYEICCVCPVLLPCVEHYALALANVWPVSVANEFGLCEFGATAV